ncbi:MAG: triose-phosphate isomerase [Chitinivibrionia bacterium]|nr:triose-phosphate isomerase [Chitinivibrionia bacterium]
MARTKLIAANWKMYKTVGEAESFVKALSRSLARLSGCDLVLFPPFTALDRVAHSLAGTRVAMGAQDLSWAPEGAYTGEISGGMIRDAGCSYVLVGHSERRTVIGETDEIVAKKLKAAFAADLIPILCVGEKLPEREAGRAEEVVREQLSAALNGVNPGEAERLVIAYEPVWAIGTGRTATPDDAEEMHSFIRKFIGLSFGRGIGSGLRIQYGGSVKPDNAAQLMGRDDIDGALVGGASLDADSFVAIALSGVPGG